MDSFLSWIFCRILLSVKFIFFAIFLSKFSPFIKKLNLLIASFIIMLWNQEIIYKNNTSGFSLIIFSEKDFCTLMWLISIWLLILYLIISYFNFTSISGKYFKRITFNLCPIYSQTYFHSPSTFVNLSRFLESHAMIREVCSGT